MPFCWSESSPYYVFTASFAGSGNFMCEYMMDHSPNMSKVRNESGYGLAWPAQVHAWCTGVEVLQELQCAGPKGTP
jgi:hypothetical protein